MLPPKSVQEEKLQENIVDSVKAAGQRDLARIEKRPLNCFESHMNYIEGAFSGLQ